MDTFSGRLGVCSSFSRRSGAQQTHVETTEDSSTEELPILGRERTSAEDNGMCYE